jgi:hypothetical protein
MRVPWSPGFPPVYVHVRWSSYGDEPCLRDHSAYHLAKKRNNPKAALSICDSLCQEPVLLSMYDDFMPRAGDRTPLIVSPTKTIHESQNALARSYARWLAKELGWAADGKIFQSRTVDRDFSENSWFRLVNQPHFFGQVEINRPYVLVDDVCGMGGTLACLRGFIESKGGRVIGMSALASNFGGNCVPIALADHTLARLNGAMDGHLPGLVAKELGYEVACLTEAEGRFLQRCSSYDEFREGIDGARDGRT